jgi:hypothetical protein
MLNFTTQPAKDAFQSRSRKTPTQGWRVSSKSSEGDPVGEKLRDVRRKLNRSWVFIRLGRQALLNQTAQDTPRAPAAKSLVRRICRETELSERQILTTDENVKHAGG